MKKIGILTSGGDCQGLNAAIRGVAKGLYEEIDDVEIYGIQNGYAGLIHGDYKKMNQSDFSGILTIGGTILGTSRQPFKMMRVIEDENSIDKVAAMKDNYKKMGLDCLVILGGNGTHKTANLLSEEGLNVVTMPKTIDNDVWGTEITFGFQSAVDIATEVIDCIHTTATSHGRIFIVEVMGHGLICMQVLQAVRIYFCCLKFLMILTKLPKLLKRENKPERDFQFLPLRRVQFQKKRQR